MHRMIQNQVQIRLQEITLLRVPKKILWTMTIGFLSHCADRQAFICLNNRHSSTKSGFLYLKSL